MSSRIKFIILHLILVAVVILPVSVRAITPASIAISVAPENPVPGEDVTVTLDSYAVNLDTLSISWFVGGEKLSSGTGVRSATVTVGASGTETVVRAVIATSEGDIEKVVYVRPASTILLWQATDSYTPPFYRGKALPTTESTIKIIAMPEIRTTSGLINAKNLVYNWKINYSADPSQSGFGKNVYTYTHDYLENNENVSVTASTADGRYSSGGNITVTPVEPNISFYQKDELQGIVWERALQDGYKVNGEGIIHAEPYFLSSKNILGALFQWSWAINGETAFNSIENKKNELPVKVEGGATGNASVNVNIENTTSLFENVSKSINVQF